LLGCLKALKVRRAADLGDAYAQAWMAWGAGGKERFRLAEKSAGQQGERDGFYCLGACYRDGIGCERDMERVQENFLVAAELGHVRAMVGAGSFLDKSDPQRFVFLGRAAVGGYPVSF
jgi:TPR repeat protein